MRATGWVQTVRGARSGARSLRSCCSSAESGCPRSFNPPVGIAIQEVLSTAPGRRPWQSWRTSRGVEANGEPAVHVGSALVPRGEVSTVSTVWSITTPSAVRCAELPRLQVSKSQNPKGNKETWESRERGMSHAVFMVWAVVFRRLREGFAKVAKGVADKPNQITQNSGRSSSWRCARRLGLMIRMGNSSLSSCSLQVCVCSAAGTRPSRASSFVTLRKKPRVFASWRGGLGLPLGEEAQSLERVFALPLGEEAVSCILERRHSLWNVFLGLLERKPFPASWRGGTIFGTCFLPLGEEAKSLECVFASWTDRR